MKSLTRLSLAALLCTGLAHAQSSPNPQKPTETDRQEKIPVETGSTELKTEEGASTVMLSPFEVTATKDTGYQATQTLAGTRIRTDLKDVASAIQVITKDYMSDIGATDNATLLQYTTNAEVSGSRGSYAGTGYGTTLNSVNSITGSQRVRGLTSADQTRDFFATNVPWDSYNTDRIDIQRGPNAILFGLGSPAGIINSSTRNAEFSDKGSVEMRIGSYGSQRTALDVNQELIKDELAIRVDGLWNLDKYQQKPAFKDDQRLYGALRWDPKFFGKDFATSIKIKAEKGKINANMPRNTTPYDSITPWFTDTGKITIGNVGSGNPADRSGPNYTVYDLSSNAGGVSPWLKSIGGQQTPTYLMSGTTGELYQINSGYINNAFLLNTGAKRGQGDNALNQRYSEMFYGIGGYRDYASASFPAVKPYYAAMTSNKMLQDNSVFDFYNNLIDGSNKGETANWTTYNFSLTQNGWGDRVGLDLNYDYQKYTSGNWGVLGGAPTISVDVTQVEQDNSVNPNYGRPYVVTQNGGGTGSSTVTERKAVRASLFAEFRASDFIKNDFLVKLIGKHRFTGVASEDTVNTETRNWNLYANSNAWDAYTTQGTGFNNNFTNRAPFAVLYLGNSLSSARTASGAGIPSVTSNAALRSGNAYLFDSTWTAQSTVSPGAVWNPTDTVAYNAQTRNYYAKVFNLSQPMTQASNPANYKGWSNERYLNLLSMAGGDPLYTSASKTQRITTSYAGSWQGYMWNQAFVPTLGWRYDKVKSRAINASQNGSDRNFLKLDGSNYILPDFTPASYYKGHSVSGGAMLHLNKLVPERWDVVPFNISLSYNDSSNFQVGGTRVDMYNNPLSNPTGKTKEYGVLISTKDNKFSFRAVEYRTKVKNATVSTDSGFFGTIQQGLKFRNVFLYQLSGYTLAANDRTGYTDTRTGPYVAGKGNSGTYINPDNSTTQVTMNTRWYWTPAYVDASGKAVQTQYYTANMGYINQSVPAGATLQTWDQTVAMRDASIRAWNDIQKTLEAKGFFAVWNMTPTTSSALTDRATYEQSLRDNGDTNAATGGLNPANSAYVPAASTVGNYGGGAPSGFSITGDQESKGYEFELTANITTNWRVAFNASKTTAVATRIGDASLEDFVAYMDTMIAGPAGEMRQYNGDFVFNNSLRKKWLDWRGNWTYLKLQEQVSNSEVRKWHYNVVTNYNFTKRWLKGTGIGAAYHWQDKVVIGYPVYLDALDYAHYDITHPVYGPTESGVDLWLSYEHRLTKKVNWKIQLNIRNAMQKDGLVPITVEPDGQTWAGVRMKPVQEWSLANTFMF